jgi:hypothetical protein
MTAEATLYPQTYRTRIRCAACWRNQPDIAQTVDPRTDELEPLCSGCSEALHNGQAVPMPSDEERVESWLWLARQHQNHRDGEETGITDATIDLALPMLTFPNLPPQQGWARFEALKHELLELQAAEDGDVDLLTLEPEWRDAEIYVNHLRGCVDDAVNKLIGRTAR